MRMITEEAYSLFFFWFSVMINGLEIKKVVEKKINEIGGFLVDLKVSSSNVISLSFDKMEGVNFDDCLKITKFIEENFDRDIEDYELNVSSAGLANPFKVEQQYIKNIGKTVNILLVNGERKSGKILSYDNKNLKIEVQKKKKETNKNNTAKHEIIIPQSDIKETKLKIKWK